MGIKTVLTKWYRCRATYKNTLDYYQCVLPFWHRKHHVSWDGSHVW